MGLDNGIRLTHLTEQQRDMYHGVYDLEDFLYWRKCWDIRKIIIDITGDRFEDEGYTKLTYDDVINFRDGLISYISQSYESWEKNCETIWEYETCMEREGGHIGRLNILISMMDENPNLVVEFYDSY